MTRHPSLEVRLAQSSAEIDAAQRLRYQVFFDEFGAKPDLASRTLQRDVDEFDGRMDHLVVIDHAIGDTACRVVGNYRLMRGERLAAGQAFYSDREFDLQPLLASGLRLLELGRSCVAPAYRGRPVLHMLWRALVAYAAAHRVDLMFGCASLRTGDHASLREQLAFLQSQHLWEEPIRPRARGANAMFVSREELPDFDSQRAYGALEPLVRGYLRQGASVAEGAYIDRQFDSADVCILMPTTRLEGVLAQQFESRSRQSRERERSVAAALPSGFP